MRYLLCILLLCALAESKGTYGSEAARPKDAQLIGVCPKCGSTDYVGYDVRDMRVSTIYHDVNGHRWGYEGGSQLIIYPDRLEGSTDFSKDRATVYPPPITRKVPANLVRTDMDESILIGRCPVCDSEHFHHYQDGDLTVYRCDKNHLWSYEQPGFTAAIVYES